MDIHRPDSGDLRREAELFQHPLFRSQLHPVASMIAALRAASSPADFEALHRELIGRFAGAERFAEKAKAEKEEARAQITQLRGTTADSDQIRPISARISALDADLYCAKAILSHYRTIGDAIVWVLLDYRRDAIAALGDGTALAISPPAQAFGRS